MTHTSLPHAELSGALFHHADLRSANLAQTTLEGTEFNGADLRGAYFTHAYFTGTQMHGADVTGTHLWPSNLESDPVAFPQLFVKIAAHLDAYGDFGRCQSGATFTGSHGVFASGSCVAKAQPGGSHGFDNTANQAASFHWEDRSQREMTVKGEHGVLLSGHCNDIWSVFTVTSVKGLPAFSTSPPHGRAAGSPGGPLVLSIHYRGYYAGIQHRDGYIVFMHGWLPRENYPTVAAGPRPL